MQSLKWLDTHCHWDAPLITEHEFSAFERRTQARCQGVMGCVVPAVSPENWENVRHWAYQHGDVYALGVHPLFLDTSTPSWLGLETALMTAVSDARCVAVGEIGLDFGHSLGQTPTQRSYQMTACEAQLHWAAQYDMPVLLHGRKAWDALLSLVRLAGVGGGVAHAFNGSLQQARRWLDAGFVLGFGGAMTYERAHHLRTLVQWVPNDGWVLETDGPDMRPQWLPPPHPNSSLEIPKIAQCFAQLKHQTLEQIATQLHTNALRVLPKWVNM